MIRLVNLPSPLGLTRALFLVIFLLSLVAGVLTVATTAAFGADEGKETIHLEPGDNYVGWVSEQIGVEDVFAAIPDAALIYTWDADRRVWRFAIRGVGGSLTALEPGMAAMIRIVGHKPVEWERPLTPAKGLVTLYRGVNWVTWVGRDDWPLDQVARGIGKSLVSIRVGDKTWPTPLDSSVDDLPTLRPGDALQVTVSRDLRWFQPTGILPNIVWAGEPRVEIKEGITRDIRDTVDYFSDIHGVETDFADTTILIWQTIEDAVSYQDDNPEFPLHLGGEALRLHLELISGAGGIGWGVFIPSGVWHANPRQSNFKAWLAHELFHYLQIQYTDRWQAAGRPPEWILEGTAVWSGEVGVRVADGHETFEQSRRTYLDNAKATNATLRSAEQRNFPWQYQLGLLAVDLLVEQRGSDSIIEYFRQQHPQTVGPNRLWQTSPSLDEAFVAAFGVGQDDFYPIFEDWRNTLPGRSVSGSDEPVLRGRLLDTDGQPATGFWINAVPYQSEHEAGRRRRVAVGTDGTFVISLLPDTQQRIYFERNGCILWLTDTGLTATQPEAGHYRDIETRRLSMLDLRLPTGACSQEHELRVEVLRLRGDDRSIAIVMNSEDGELWLSVSRAPSGGYLAFAPEPGRYRIKLIVGGCELWYRSSGPVAQRGKGDSLVLSRQSMSIKFRVPDDMCIRTIRGRAVTGEGRPAHARLLYAYKHDVYGRATWGEDGQFAITVPEAGEYRVYVWDGCPVYLGNSSFTTEWHQATPISVEDEDVSGIEFVVPADPSSLCK